MFGKPRLKVLAFTSLRKSDGPILRDSFSMGRLWGPCKEDLALAHGPTPNIVWVD